MGAQFQVPLQQVIPNQLISSALWNAEWNNLSTNLTPAGIDSYSNTDSQMQIQTNPYPGSVTSHATNMGGELERIRYMLAQLTGNPLWYQPPSVSVATLFNSILPIGAVIDFPSPTAPNSNFHLADGTAINRVLFPALFTLIGTTFGAGDGTTTFNLPDYRDKMSIGAGNSYALAATGGATTHTLTTAELPATPVTVSITDPGHTHSITDPTHSHGITDPTHSHSVPGTSGGGVSSTFSANVNQNNAPRNTAASSTGVTVNSSSTGISNNSNTTGITASGVIAGSGAAHSILNPYLSMYKMIRVI